MDEGMGRERRINAGRMNGLPAVGCCPWQRNTSGRGQSYVYEPTDWRAGCGRPARPVRREGQGQSLVPTLSIPGVRDSTPFETLHRFVKEKQPVKIACFGFRCFYFPTPCQRCRLPTRADNPPLLFPKRSRLCASNPIAFRGGTSARGPSSRSRCCNCLAIQISTR